MIHVGKGELGPLDDGGLARHGSSITTRSPRVWELFSRLGKRIIQLLIPQENPSAPHSPFLIILSTEVGVTLRSGLMRSLEGELEVPSFHKRTPHEVATSSV